MKTKTVRFDDGSEVTIVNDNGRFYIAEDGTQYRKSNRHIISVENRKALYVQNVVVPEDENEKPEKPAKKKASAKKSTKKKED